MDSNKDCIAILISAPSLDQPTLAQAELARELTKAKVAAAQDIVSGGRCKDAQQMLTDNMRILFHQGGAPSKWEGRVPNVGRLIAAGYLKSIAPLDNINPSPDAHLLVITRRIFPNKDLQGFLWFSDVRRIPSPILTKSPLALGRWPKPQENYIVVCPGESHYNELLGTWQSAFREEIRT